MGDHRLDKTMLELKYFREHLGSTLGRCYGVSLGNYRVGFGVLVFESIAAWGLSLGLPCRASAFSSW